ncbi:hypothetical protein B0H15DRAFT_937533 [Mycena belliarum]|uniref:Uncharacterized protein n=1 Tax=Mycena belliarum TaxID=1033014 RepID=A0AAD6XYI1_9AGAR|nr:hypothetical protein B0H15DRAFT_937533 [Mycena belliae]
MSIPWRNRFLLLLVPSILSFLFFLSYRSHAEDPGLLLNQNASEESNPVADSGPPPNILLVTAFFPLSKSKHTLPEYEWWLYQFLAGVSTDVYFYVAPEMAQLVRRCRGDLPITIDTRFGSPFEIPPLNGTRARYDAMHALDREAARHSPELYAVWNTKPFFLDEAVQVLARGGKEYDYAFWTDAGSFRSTHRYKEWPSPARVREIWQEASVLTGEKTEDLLFFPLTGMPSARSRRWTETQGPVDAEFSEGSFFGGSPRTVAWWRATYYAYHDYYLSLGLFVGKDQTLINALFLLFPARVVAVWLGDPVPAPVVRLLPLVDEGALGHCGAEWYYYQFWLAGAGERAAMRALWDGEMRWGWAWWKRRQRWAPPVHTVTA